MHHTSLRTSTIAEGSEPGSWVATPCSPSYCATVPSSPSTTSAAAATAAAMAEHPNMPHPPSEWQRGASPAAATPPPAHPATHSLAQEAAASAQWQPRGPFAPAPVQADVSCTTPFHTPPSSPGGSPRNSPHGQCSPLAGASTASGDSFVATAAAYSARLAATGCSTAAAEAAEAAAAAFAVERRSHQLRTGAPSEEPPLVKYHGGPGGHARSRSTGAPAGISSAGPLQPLSMGDCAHNV